MLGELVWTTTPDRTRLHGFWARGTNTGQTPWDAVLIIHGLAGNFYNSGLLNFLARSWHDSGTSVLLGNTRGHDLLSLSAHQGRTVLAGSAVEDVGDAAADLEGWFRFLTGQGCERILLVGHSLGGIKSLLAQATRPAPQVIAILALSATRLNHQQFLQSSAGETFAGDFGRARELTEQGRGTEITHFHFPFPTWMQASSYCDKYGPASAYDWTKVIAAVTVPVLLTYGERELNEHPAFETVREVVQETIAPLANATLCEIPGADHFYVGCFDALWNALRDWLRLNV